MFQFSVNSGGMYSRGHAIVHPITKQVMGYESHAAGRYDLSRNNRFNEPHQHNRERLRRYRQRYGRNDPHYLEAISAISN